MVNWKNPSLNTSGWGIMNVPGYWAGTSSGPLNGVVWFRKKFNIPSNMAGKEALLILGRLVDADSVFINGRFVGSTGYQYPPRRYSIPEGLLLEGENTIVVRIINTSGIGGFVPDKIYEIISGDDRIDLRGDWQYRVGAQMAPLADQTFIRWKPLGLFNGMIHPLLNYQIKGVVWYQGESNTTKALEYRRLLPALIKDWRRNWSEGDFPFIFAQLPNFMEVKSAPGESDWALLREAHLKTLSVPNTGMAVTIDLGEWNDVHPLNKKDVGKRLALSARKIAYGESLVSSGPLLKEMKIKRNKAILSFDHCGSGLIAKGGTLNYFSMAGADRKFHWAKAKIRKNTVIVWCEKVPHPMAVRYAWADNPEGANLYNREGLPASPFRTDDE
jgi:sialate O-acetylesterase